MDKDIKFIAIDFETANSDRDSACSLGLVEFNLSKITNQKHYLINPNTSVFSNYARNHWVSKAMVSDAPDFMEVWKEIKNKFYNSDFIVAHNYSFERSVIQRNFWKRRLYDEDDKLLEIRWMCTVELARSYFSISPTTLPNVCRKLGIDLNHHDALSDALASCKILQKIIEMILEHKQRLGLSGSDVRDILIGMSK